MNRVSDWNQFLTGMKVLCETFQREPSELLVLAYWKALDHLSIEEFERAVIKAVGSLRFFPKPVELRELVRGDAGAEAALAWDRVERAMSSFGTYRSVQFDDPAIHLAIESMGGWVSFGTREPDGEDWHRKEFERLYRIALDRIERAGLDRARPPLVLAGLYELQGQESPPRQVGDLTAIEEWTRAAGPKPARLTADAEQLADMIGAERKPTNEV